MKKIFSWIFKNILFVCTIFLLAFIPLYPKIPLLDVKNTWVYVRAEDFVVLAVLFLWVILFFLKKITLKTPLTLPIMIFWAIGAIATIHGVVLIFPSLPNVFPNVAFLSFLRHLEYMSLFFVAYSSMRDKRFLSIVLFVILGTLLLVIAYGAGQKYLGFPAYLTMNEEFAKGIPIRLSALSRLPSTFGGHYDLGAYLVLTVPILVSLAIGFRNWIIKALLGVSSALGFWLLFMTVSRVSFFVLFLSIFIVLYFYKKRLVILSIPIIALLGVIFVSFAPSLFDRFGNTVREVNVLVDAKTGEAVGHVNYVASEYFKDKIVLQQRVEDKEQLDIALTGEIEKIPQASPSAIVPLELIPSEVPLVVATNVSTGENLPQGTGYINLSLSPVTRRLGNFYYEFPPDSKTTSSAEILILHGDFIVKRAAAYDLSFTTRFQGEWPRALAAFSKNVLLGSGYGSVSLAVDNNYFRMLGETGLLGLASFAAIFLTIGIYIRKILPDVESETVRSFVFGFVAGVVGLALNAVLIDVFEASKIAFSLWILTGVTLGTLALYQKKRVNLYREIKNFAISPFAIVLYLLILSITIFSPMISNFFTGDDFTWFRWAAESSKNPIDSVLRYFTSSGGFFYRPGTKIYFYLMHNVFWLNQAIFHAVSIAIHFVVTALFFLLAKRILKSYLLAVFSAFLFLILSGYSEIVFWTAATGYLFNAMFALLGLTLFIWWDERKNVLYYVGSILSISLSTLFHELGVVVPLLIILYKTFYDKTFKIRTLARVEYLFLLVPIIIYLFARFTAGSHWTGGDYSYNLVKLPFNAVGNLLGYIGLGFFGPASLPFYEALRTVMREQILPSAVVGVAFFLTVAFLFPKIFRKLSIEDRKIALFGFLFFVISLFPFLGFGNIASRYSYLASLGLILLLALAAKKTYSYLIYSGRDIARITISIIILVFVLLHVIQVQQTHRDWHGAGEKVKKFFVSIDALYSNYWIDEGVELHFVNVPIRDGQAWVFPVGLHDAVWLSFKDDGIKVYIHEKLSEALTLAGDSLNKRVFVFQDDGSVAEAVRNRRGMSTAPRDKPGPESLTPVRTR